MKVTGYNKTLYFYRNHTATFAKMTVAIPQLLVKKIATKVRPWPLLVPI